MSGRQAWWAAAVVLAVTLVPFVAAGCSAEPKTVALAPLAPAVDGADAAPAYPHTRLGAAAFVRAFFREINRALSTGSTSGMLALSTDACEACRRMAGFIATAHARRRTVLGGRLTVQSAVAAPPTGNRIRVTAIVDESPQRVVEASGRLVDHDGASTGVDNEVELVWDHGWRVDRVTLFRQ